MLTGVKRVDLILVSDNSADLRMLRVVENLGDLTSETCELNQA